MNLINSYQPNTQGKWNFNAFGSSSNDRQLTRVSESHQENKDITILTADGDRVTISSNQRSHAAYSQYSAVSQQRTYAEFGNMTVDQRRYAMFRGEEFEFENSRYFSISVDGDLDEQELADIRKAIKAIDKIMTDILYGGDVAKGVGKAIELVSLDTISGIAADYGYEEAVSVEKMEVADVSTYNKDGRIETLLPGYHEAADSLENLINEMIEILKQSAVKPSKIAKPLNMLFSEILRNLSSNPHRNQPKIDLVNLIEAALLEEVNHMDEQLTLPLKPSLQKLTNN